MKYEISFEVHTHFDYYDKELMKEEKDLIAGVLETRLEKTFSKIKNIKIIQKHDGEK